MPPPRPHASTTNPATPTAASEALLDHLATLTRNQIRYAGTDTEIPMLAEATPDQRRAFELLDTAIPLRAA